MVQIHSPRPFYLRSHVDLCCNRAFLFTAEGCPRRRFSGSNVYVGQLEAYNSLVCPLLPPNDILDQLLSVACLHFGVRSTAP
jgi:hypothetical protein